MPPEEAHTFRQCECEGPGFSSFQLVQNVMAIFVCYCQFRHIFILLCAAFSSRPVPYVPSVRRPIVKPLRCISGHDYAFLAKKKEDKPGGSRAMREWIAYEAVKGGYLCLIFFTLRRRLQGGSMRSCKASCWLHAYHGLTRTLNTVAP